MSLFGSLFSSASGLTAQSRAMGMISDNISNVNTTGYKGAIARFSTLVTRNTRNVSYSPGGVRALTEQLVSKQGLIQSTDSATDAAISGAGFFVVNEKADSSGEQLYTRAGSFSPDNLGYLRTPAGFFLQGWLLDADEEIVDINSLETVNVRTLNGIAIATSTVEFGANLDASTTAYSGAYTAGDMETYNSTGGTSGVQPQFTRTIKVFDALGKGHNITLAFLKTADNTWAMEVYADTSELDSAVHSTGLLASGTLTFNGDGTFSSASGTIGSAVSISWANGADASSITFDLGTADKTDGMTQFASANDVAFVIQNGSEVGQVNGVQIDEDGYVNVSFTNGATRKIYRLPVATFANPNALDPRTGNVYAQTEESGENNLKFTGQGGAGIVAPASLEAANVDLADEFTKMIITQRAYTANARVVTTANDMLSELMQIAR